MFYFLLDHAASISQRSLNEIVHRFFFLLPLFLQFFFFDSMSHTAKSALDGQAAWATQAAVLKGLNRGGLNGKVDLGSLTRK